MDTHRERFDQGALYTRQAAGDFQDRILRHENVFGKSAVSIDPQQTEMFADVGHSHLADVALATRKERKNCHPIADLKLRTRLLWQLNNLAHEFVAHHQWGPGARMFARGDR
jgi:hypothetical protein